MLQESKFHICWYERIRFQRFNIQRCISWESSSLQSKFHRLEKLHPYKSWISILSSRRQFEMTVISRVILTNRKINRKLLVYWFFKNKMAPHLIIVFNFIFIFSFWYYTFIPITGHPQIMLIPFNASHNIQVNICFLDSYMGYLLLEKSHEDVHK